MLLTSSSLYGPKSFQKSLLKQALREVRSKDIDGVITIGLVDKNKEKTYMPDYGYRPYGWGYRPWARGVTCIDLIMYLVFADIMKQT